MEIFGTAVTVLLIAAGLLIRNNIYLTSVNMLWIWIVMAFNYDGVDYNGNELIYQNFGNAVENPALAAIHWLPDMLIDWAHENGLEYWEYNGMIVSFLLLVFFVMIVKNVRNHTAYFSLFMIYPFMDSVFQKRFFIAMMLCVVALWLAANKKKVPYVVLTFIGVGFHFTAIFNFLYIFVGWLKKKSPFVLVLLFMAEIALLVLFRDYLLLAVAVDNAKVAEYIGGNAISLFAGILFVLTQVGFVCLTDFILHRYKEDGRAEFIRNINISSLFFLPFLLTDAVFFRFYRIVMLLSYMYIADCLIGKFICNNRHYYMTIIYIFLLVAWVCVVASFDKVGWTVFLETLFKYNKVIGL